MNTAQGVDGPLHGDTRAAGLVLWTDDGKILVGRGATTGEWSEPGGKLERGEAARACASRELYEETRLSADDLEIDWEQPLYNAQCKYTFFQGRLGDYQPAPTAVFTEYTYMHPRDATIDCTFRLRCVVSALGNSVPRPRPTDLTSCWTGSAQTAPPSTTSTGRAKQAGAKRKFDAAEGEREGSSSPQVVQRPPSAAEELVSSASTPAQAPTEAASSTNNSPMLTATGRRVALMLRR